MSDTPTREAVEQASQGGHMDRQLADTLTVRDHSQPCEHPLDPLAMYDGAYFDDEGGYWRCGFGLCPGGREIVIGVGFPNLQQIRNAMKVTTPPANEAIAIFRALAYLLLGDLVEVSDET